MAEKLTFPFVKKEGKYFTPIVQTQTRYRIDGGAVVEDGSKIVGGIKGVFAKVRLRINTPTMAELFAVNTEYFNSSN